MQKYLFFLKIKYSCFSENCLDGVCDEYEQLDKSLCPQDCFPTNKGKAKLSNSMLYGIDFEGRCTICLQSDEIAQTQT